MNFLERFFSSIAGKKLEKSLKGIKGNWKTTLLAVLAAVILILTEVKDLLDGNPKTVFEWEKFWTLGIIVLIGLFAKDSDKTSEELGLK